MDISELPADLQIKVTNLTDALSNIESSIDATVDFANFDDLTTEEKVKYDLYLSYSINSLYWTYCRLQAIEPNNHGIKNEISRVRTAMMRDKQLLEHRTIRPVIDSAAAGRFVRNGLWDPNKKKIEKDQRASAAKPRARVHKRKFED